MIFYRQKSSKPELGSTKVPTVPESILKKRKKRAQSKAKALQNAIKDRKVLLN
jgi:hypothetical protein